MFKTINTSKFLIVTLAGIFSFTGLAQAKIGSPTKIRCDLGIHVHNEDINQLMDINALIENSRYEKLGSVDATCRKHNGKVVTCESVIEDQAFYIRYHFNTQNGGLEIEDIVSGQSARVTWLNQHDVLESGYLLGRVNLTNRRGGLMGNQRIFQIESGCWALEWDK